MKVGGRNYIIRTLPFFVPVNFIVILSQQCLSGHISRNRKTNTILSLSARVRRLHTTEGPVWRNQSTRSVRIRKTRNILDKKWLFYAQTPPLPQLKIHLRTKCYRNSERLMREKRQIRLSPWAPANKTRQTFVFGVYCFRNNDTYYYSKYLSRRVGRLTTSVYYTVFRYGKTIVHNLYRGLKIKNKNSNVKYTVRNIINPLLTPITIYNRKYFHPRSNTPRGGRGWIFPT